MKAKLFFILCALFIGTQTAQAQTWTWLIGSPNSADITATFNTADSTLTIRGTGNMQNWSGGLHIPPWTGQPIRTVIIEQGVTRIGDFAFAGSTRLTSVTIPSSVTTIGAVAFRNATSLAKITIPYGVTRIGSSAFEGCTGLTEIVIPNSVTAILSSAFSGCTSLTEIVIPNSVITIGAGAFLNCISLTSITIGAGVTSIGASAFAGCTSLTAINVNANNTAFMSENGVLFNKNKTTLIQFPSAKQITTYTIPNSVTSIGDGAFRNSGLTSVTIGESVTSIERMAFDGSRSLVEITIPNSVTSIGEWAFTGTGLTDIYVFWTTPPNISSGVFGSVFSSVWNANLHIPKGTLSTYQNAPVWQNFNLVERAETSVDIVENDSVNLFTTANGIFVDAKETVQITVYNLLGQKMYQSVVFGSREIALPAGIYIVNVNGQSQKLIVR